jgi:hypothetical protein
MEAMKGLYNLDSIRMDGWMGIHGCIHIYIIDLTHTHTHVLIHK